MCHYYVPTVCGVTDGYGIRPFTGHFSPIGHSPSERGNGISCFEAVRDCRLADGHFSVSRRIFEKAEQRQQTCILKRKKYQHKLPNIV